MKIACNVIQDLMPLYIEKIASKETEQLVEEHLRECEKCKREFEGGDEFNGKNLSLLEKSDERIPLTIMKKSINSRKRKTTLLASFIVFLIMFTIFSYLAKPRYCSYENSGIVVNANDNKEIYVTFTGEVTSYKLTKSVTENGKDILEIEAWTSVWDNILGKSTPAIFVASSGESIPTVYYCDYTEEDNMKIVYGENPYHNGGVLSLPRLVLGYYFTMACVVTVLFGVIWFLVRKNKKISRICEALFFIPVSYIIAVIILQNGFLTFSAMRDFSMNMIATIAIYGIWILGLDLYRQYREDRIDSISFGIR